MKCAPPEGKGAPTCPSTAYQGAKTLCIHMIWMWNAVYGGLEGPSTDKTKTHQKCILASKMRKKTVRLHVSYMTKYFFFKIPLDEYSYGTPKIFIPKHSIVIQDSCELFLVGGQNWNHFSAPITGMFFHFPAGAQRNPEDHN